MHRMAQTDHRKHGRTRAHRQKCNGSRTGDRFSLGTDRHSRSTHGYSHRKQTAHGLQQPLQDLCIVRGEHSVPGKCRDAQITLRLPTILHTQVLYSEMKVGLQFSAA